MDMYAISINILIQEELLGIIHIIIGKFILYNIVYHKRNKNG